MTWTAGTPILLRETWQGRVWTAQPVRVVQDSPDLLVLHMQPGTVCKHPGDSTPFLSDDWTLADRVWTGGDALYLCPPGAWHMVILFFTPPPARQLQHWYVNLQTPLRRRPLGFDYLDQELDLIVSLDRKTWRWKDEERFADAQRRGRISPDDARRVRAEGERVIAQIAGDDSPFAHGWEHWRAPSDWREPPTLPPDWRMTS